jgi:hypothetical protein
MEDTGFKQQVLASLTTVGKTWEEPAIVLERSLEAAAEGIPPAGRRAARVRSNGFLGPLGTSGGSGNC